MTDQYRFIDEPKKPGGKPQHLHTLNGVPLYGTTTVLDVVHKELAWWASGMAVGRLGWIATKAPKEERFAAALKGMQEMVDLLTSPEDTDVRETVEKYQALLDEAYRAHKTKLDDSAETGIDMHAELESYVRWCIFDNDGEPTLDYKGVTGHAAVRIFAEWALDNVQEFLFSEAHCYSKEMWTGGVVDLMYRHAEYGLGLLDFKSAKEPYDTHFMQNAAYDIAISENGIFKADGTLVDDDPGLITHYAVLPFGMMPEPKVFIREDTWECQEAFRHALGLYRFLKVNMKKY